MCAPDYGLAESVRALWPWRTFPAQRKALRHVLAACREVREYWRDEERQANFDLSMYLMELDQMTVE